MKKSTVIWLITAGCLIIAAFVIFISAMALHGWDIKKISTQKTNIKTYPLTDSFEDISISGTTEDISFVPCEKEQSKVVIENVSGVETVVSVENGKLAVSSKDTRKWYEFIDFFFGQTKITVYIPEAAYGDLSINNGTGDINIPDRFSFKNIALKTSTGGIDNAASTNGNIKISVSTGDVKIKNVSPLDFELSSSTGDVYLEGVTASENMKIKTSTGDIRLVNCDAKSLEFKSSTGDISGVLLTEKVFSARTSTGKVSLPDTKSGGKCKVTTSTGNIRFSVKGLQ